MGKLPIILRGGDTPDDARAACREQGSAATVAVIGDAVARSETICRTIADRRDPLREIALREECTRGNGRRDRRVEVAIGADAAARPIATIAAWIGDSARRRRQRRDAVALARTRGYTWQESESKYQEANTDRSGSTWSYVIGNNDRERNCAVPFATPSRSEDAERRGRIAGDDRVDLTIASFSARRVRTRDRVIRSNLVGRTERRDRRHCDASPACSGTIGASIGSRSEMENNVLRCAMVDSITPVERNRSSVPPVTTGTTDTSSGGINDTRTDAHNRSASTVFEVRERSIGGDVNAGCESTTSTRDTSNHATKRFTDDDTASSRRSRLIGRLNAITGFADSPASTQLPAKIDPGGTKWTRTDCTYRWGPSLGICFVLRALLGLLAICLLCEMVTAAPSSSSAALGHSQTLETFEDGPIEDEELAMSRNKLGEDELEIIRRSIVQGLGLQRIPDPSKVCPCCTYIQ